MRLENVPYEIIWICRCGGEGEMGIIKLCLLCLLWKSDYYIFCSFWRLFGKIQTTSGFGKIFGKIQTLMRSLPLVPPGKPYAFYSFICKKKTYFYFFLIRLGHLSFTLKINQLFKGQTHIYTLQVRKKGYEKCTYIYIHLSKRKAGSIR